MTSRELRERFINFFVRNSHKRIKSSPLMPSDPSVLFTTAGMQQFVEYLAGKKDPVQDFGSRHLCSVQKCFRTNDIEEIGDSTHHTLFEMMGNWSIGTDENSHYFKESAIKYALEFLQDIGFEKEKMWATIYRGDDAIEKDAEASVLWKQNGIPEERIVACGKDNFWGPTAETGPCGPCSEIHYDRGEKYGCGKATCGPNCPDCNRYVEIWNLVFMQYFKNAEGKFEKMQQTNVDTGSGFERVYTILKEKDSAFETDIFLPIIEKIEEYSSKKYAENKKAYRIVADHIRSVCFLVADGFEPGKVGQSYIVRRLIRRVVRNARPIDFDLSNVAKVINVVISNFGDIYPELQENEAKIVEIVLEEIGRFEQSLEKGLKILDNIEDKNITSKQAFDLYQTYGFPIEMLREEAQNRGWQIDEKGLEREITKHQEISRAGAAKLFGGHGAQDADPEAKEKIVKLHTATHLLQAALRKVLGDSIKQMGSNIDESRLRFDFSFDRKLTPEEIEKVELLVNEQIEKNVDVTKECMRYEDAIESGALAFFKEKYPEQVDVYSIGDFSKELCGGPHVKNTRELGKFKISKQESSSAGVRRIKAILE